MGKSCSRAANFALLKHGFRYSNLDELYYAPLAVLDVRAVGEAFTLYSLRQGVPYYPQIHNA